MAIDPEVRALTDRFRAAADRTVALATPPAGTVEARDVDGLAARWIDVIGGVLAAPVTDAEVV